MNNHFRAAVAAVLLFSFVLAAAASAAESRDERALRQETARLNALTGQENGERTVAGALSKEFSVSADQIKALRDRKLGYGEIAIVCSLAQDMPGGITSGNIDKVLALRQGPPVMGWGRVAKELGTKLGPTVSQVRNMNRSSEQEMKQARGNSGAAKEQAGGRQSGDQSQMRDQRGRDHSGGMRGGRMK